MASFAVLGLHARQNVQGDEPFTWPFTLGLDLQGGISLVLRADMSKAPKGVTRENVMESVMENVERRIVGNTGKEIEMSTVGEDMIAAEIPGEKDPKKVVDLLVKTAQMVFVDTGDPKENGSLFAPGKKVLGEADDNMRIARLAAYEQLHPDVLEKVKKKESKKKKKDEEADKRPTGAVDPAVLPKGYDEDDYFADREKPVHVYKDKEVIIRGDDLQKAHVEADRFNRQNVGFKLNSKAANGFGNHTATHIGKMMTIVLDDEVISSPVIRSAIYGGSGQITGDFTQEEAQRLVRQLNAGALPVPLSIEEERVVGPTLGAEAIRQSTLAFAAGLVLVLIFMAVYYRIPGLLAGVALAIYTLVLAALFALLEVTLTLPGIAGFILSIGMAVDTNIITFERIRDEVANRGVFGNVVMDGHEHAAVAIWDSQMTTLIAGVVLYLLGTGPVKSFAVALSLGTVTSLFSGLFVTQLLLRAVQGKVTATNNWFGKAEPKGAKA